MLFRPSFSSRAFSALAGAESVLVVVLDSPPTVDVLPYSRWSWVSQYQDVSILDFTGAEDNGGGGDNEL